MEHTFFNTGGSIHFPPPEKDIEGEVSGIKWPLTFYFDTEKELQAAQLFFNDGSVRPSIATLLLCIEAHKGKYGC
jgi:hypothetical protein